MSWSIHLTDSDSLFQKRIITEFLRQINPKLRKSKAKLSTEVGNILSAAVNESKEVQSMLHGTLSAELGFISAASIVKQITKAVQRSVRVESEAFKYQGGKQIIGKFSIVAIHDDFSDLISEIPSAAYTSNGYNVEWLKWLLFEGNNLIIADYEIIYGTYGRGHSRSGKAIMQENLAGSGYRIPSKFAGTQYDNFITRSINEEVEKRVLAAMEKVLI